MGKLKSLEGMTAVVTGASSGIGRALAMELGRHGARVALLARRPEALASAAAEVASVGGTARPFPCDVGDRGEVVRVMGRVEEELGPVELLVNNAGYGGHRNFLQWDLDDMERMMRVNFFGSVYCTRAVLRGMLERGTGWIVFMASVAGKIATPGESAYVASKFATVGLAASLSMEVEDAGVHVLTVCPGTVRTPFFTPDELAKLPPVARKRMVTPEELAEAVLEALRAGRRELTYPRWMASAYVVQGIAPAFVRRQVRKTVLGGGAGAWPG